MTILELQTGFNDECVNLLEGQKHIRQVADDTKYALEKKVDAERTDKSLQLGAFRDDTTKKLSQ